MVGGLNYSGVVDSDDRLAAIKLLAGTCLLIHSFIAERVGPYIKGDWVRLGGTGGEPMLSRNGTLVVVVSGPAWVGQLPGCTALAFHSIEVHWGIQRCIEAVTDCWSWGRLALEKHLAAVQ